MKIQIISGKGHWTNGWLPTTSALQHFIKVVEQNGIEVKANEVKNLGELEDLLAQIDPESLILPNAYHVNETNESSETVWMGEILDQFNFKVIGSGTKSLQNVLQKHVCQQILKKHGILVPEFAFILPKDLGKEKTILREAAFTYPAIVKLTGESCGVGIDEQSVVTDEEEAISQIREMLQTYDQGVIIETLLQGKDITAARFEIGGRSLHLTTHYQIKNRSILGYEERQMPWGNGKSMTPVKEAFILKQIDKILPKVWDALDIRDIVRVDGKLDANGQFRIFDVNGFPGLIPDKNTFPVQCNVCFSKFPKSDVYDAMVNTILLSAAHRHRIPVPDALKQHNLFTLRTETTKTKNNLSKAHT